MSLKQLIATLPSDLQEKAKNVTSLEELKDILDAENRELTEDELGLVAGGMNVRECCGDVREEFDSSKMSASFLSGADLGF